jgi:hypothetical protein
LSTLTRAGSRPDHAIPARLAVPDWEEFQHYKGRTPPWIKLHRDLLINRAFMQLPIVAKALLPLLWLLASESRDPRVGDFAADLADLEFRLRMPAEQLREGLVALMDAGLLVDASTVQAAASTVQATASTVQAAASTVQATASAVLADAGAVHRSASSEREAEADGEAEPEAEQQPIPKPIHQSPVHQSPAAGESRESPEEPPPAAQQQQPTTGDVIWECGAFAVEMHSGEHPVEKMNPDVHASDVMRLMERLPGAAAPSDVRSPEAIQRARRELAKRAIRFCPVPERLARWLAVAYREYRVENLGAYLHKACESGDPGTLLNQHGDGAGCFHPEHEAALQGRHAADVTALVEAGRGKLAAEPKEVTLA